MIAAVVTGNVWSTRQVEGLPSGAFIEVEALGHGARFIAFDVLGVGVGEHVLVTQGSAAASWFPGPPPPVDALIIGSIDQPSSPSPEGTEHTPSPSARPDPTQRSTNVQ